MGPMMMEAKLDRQTILQALSLLNDELRKGEAIGEICIFGGATMILAFDGQFATRDVDAIFVPKGKVTDAIARIADQMDLPEAWLNDGVKGGLSSKEDFTTSDMPQFENLRVLRPTAEYLLAMKCLASRVASYGARGDLRDIWSLCQHLNLTEVEQVVAVILNYYPESEVSTKARYFVEEILQEGAAGNL